MHLKNFISAFVRSTMPILDFTLTLLSVVLAVAVLNGAVTELRRHVDTLVTNALNLPARSGARGK